MKNLLYKALTEELPVDIYINIKNNEKKTCELIYSAFLITNIDEVKNTFSGYTIEERAKKIENKIITEESISLICDVKF